MRYLVVAMFLWVVGTGTVDAQQGLESFLNKYKVTTQLGFQFASTYTLDQSIYNSSEDNYQQVDNRLTFQLRRSRLVLKASPYNNFNFSMVTNLDFVGRDVLSAEQGGDNNGAQPGFGFWDLKMGYKMIDSSDLVHLTFGYFHPQFGRVGITPAMAATSFEKPWAQNYVRRTMVGTGPGRAMGFNLGGQYWEEGKLFGLRYDVGIFSPITTAYSGNSSGSSSSNLITGKLGISLGEPESKNYSLGHVINYYNERRGITLGFQGAHQGKTDLFETNNLYGVDILFNFDHLNIDGEWTTMKRSGMDASGTFTIKSNVKYIRVSYNIGDDAIHMIEPVISFVKFDGPMAFGQQSRALQVGAFAGNDTILELACRFHFSRTLRFTLAYTSNSGDAGETGPGAEFNNYLSQGGVGAIKRGDLIGASMVILM